MRVWSAAVLIVLSAPVALAQPRPAATLPPIGLPLPAIGLPLPPLGLAPASEVRTPAAPTPRSSRPRRPAPWIWGPAIVYVPVPGVAPARPGEIVPTLDASSSPPAPADADARAAQAPAPRPPSAVPAASPVVPEPAPAPAPPPVSKPLYFVPRCYLGDVPPAEANLPPDCDLAKTVVYRR